jgi:hypothetical protein
MVRGTVRVRVRVKEMEKKRREEVVVMLGEVKDC